MTWQLVPIETTGEDRDGLPTVRATFTHSHFVGWRLSVQLQSIDSRAAVTKISFERDEAVLATPETANAALLRSVSIVDTRAQVLRFVAGLGVISRDDPAVAEVAATTRTSPPDWLFDSPTSYGDFAVRMLGEQKPGRKGHPDIYYAKAARQYSLLVGQHAPNKKLATQRGEGRASIRWLIGECRKRGLLTPAKRGVTTGSGELTDKAREILGGAHPEEG